MKKVALVVALILVLAFAAFKQQQAPMVVTCGSVSGGQTLTAKGTDWAQKFGGWVHKVATNPEQYRDPNAIEETIHGIAKDVLWYWVKSAFQSSRGEKIDPLIVQLQQDNARAQDAANRYCTPCPQAAPPSPDTGTDPNGGSDEPADPRVQFTSSVGSGTQTGSQVAITAASKYPWPLRTAVAIAGAESTYRPTASLTYRGQHMRGLWQINDGAHPDLLRGRDWTDPAQNAWMAYQVYKAAGNSFQPWSTYTSGAYKQFLNSSLSNTPGAQGQTGSVGPDALVPDDDDPATATPTPGCAGATGGPDARVGSWNVEYGNSTNNVRAGLTDLAKQADVVGLQEVSPTMRHTLANVKGWAMTTNNSATPILYNPTRYDLVGQGVVRALPAGIPVEYSHADGARDAGPKSIVWVQLKDKATGTVFYVVNTHMLVGKSAGPKRLAAYNRQMRALIHVIADKRTTGAAVLTTCDCNDRWGASQTSVKSMAAVGAIANWQTLRGPSTHGKATIDYVWAAGASPASQTVLAAHGSDHRALVVTFHAAAPNVVSSSVAVAGVRTVTDPTSKQTYQIPIPAGPRGVAINFALDQLGKPYRWATKGPSNYDCSGLVSAAWAKAGVDFTAQTGVMLRTIPKTGTPQPGDLPTTNEHTQMELGVIGGEHLIIEAPRTGLTVRIVKEWMTPTSVLDPTKMGQPA